MSSKTIRNSAAAVIVAGMAGYLSLRAESVQRTLCAVSQKLGVCGANSLPSGRDAASLSCVSSPGCNVSIGDESGTEYTGNERKVISEGKEIAKAYDSRMVPSTFLIDREGRVTKKLVGYKDQSTLDQALDELVSLFVKRTPHNPVKYQIMIKICRNPGGLVSKGTLSRLAVWVSVNF
jgi:hypothetical protein